MELKSLVLGILFSMGIFAVKSGVGLNYLVRRAKRPGTILGVLCGWSGAYLIVFGLVFYILRYIDFLGNIEMIQNLISSGMLVHVAMAAFMAAYGLMLLKKRDHAGKSASGWLLLVFPCPVCLTVILFTLAFLLAYFPATGWGAVLATYAGFVGVALLTLVLMKTIFAKEHFSPEAVLGSAMLLIAVYFIVSIVIMPQFGDIEKIYRLAAYQGRHTEISLDHAGWLGLTIAAFFTMGFTSTRRTIRRIKN